MLAESVRTTSSLVSTQLVQIQATFDTRVTKLEASQLTQAGRSSVADPALSDALTRITASVASMKLDQEASMARVSAAVATMQTSESSSAGQRRGMTDTNARMLAVVMAISSIATPIVAVVAVLVATHMGH
jgi:hypothetical protein